MKDLEIKIENISRKYRLVTTCRGLRQFHKIRRILLIETYKDILKEAEMTTSKRELVKYIKICLERLEKENETTGNQF